MSLKRVSDQYDKRMLLGALCPVSVRLRDGLLSKLILLLDPPRAENARPEVTPIYTDRTPRNPGFYEGSPAEAFAAMAQNYPLFELVAK